MTDGTGLSTICRQLKLPTADRNRLSTKGKLKSFYKLTVGKTEDTSVTRYFRITAADGKTYNEKQVIK